MNLLLYNCDVSNNDYFKKTKNKSHWFLYDTIIYYIFKKDFDNNITNKAE